MTILFTPGTYPAVHNDLFYTVSDAKASDPVTYPNYKYVADVYINGTFITRLRKFPDPVFNFGLFNIGAIVRNYINVVFNANSVLFSMSFGQGTFNADVQLKFGEEYGFTTTYNIVTDSTRKVYNYYNRLLKGTTTPLANFTDKITTNGLKTTALLSPFRALLSTDFLFISYFATTTTPISVSVTGNGTYTTTVTPASANSLIVLNVSPVLINVLRANTINSTLDYYTVTIGSDTIRINLFCEAIYNVYPIHFLNQYGGFETVIFSKVSRQNVKVDKKSFNTLPYQVDAGGAVNYLNGSYIYYESDYNYANTFSTLLTLNSHLLNDYEYIWLEDLIESPLVYIQANGFFYPIKITNTDYEIKKQVNETDLNNLTITVDFGKTFNTQFR